MCSLGARQLTNAAYVAVFKIRPPGSLGSNAYGFHLSVHGGPIAFPLGVLAILAWMRSTCRSALLGKWPNERARRPARLAC
jgi:hypothetical protein